MRSKKQMIAITLLLSLFAFIYTIAAGNKKADELYAGAAKIDITPSEPIRLSGYEPRSPIRSHGVHDPIFVKALALEADGNRLVVVTCDLLGYYNQATLEKIKSKYDVEHVLISSSHTHSGPNLDDSESYAALVEKAMLDAAGKAIDNMTPAKISAGYKSFPQLGYNRLVNKTDLISMYVNYERVPYGPVDPEVGVIKIEDARGNIKAILMQYACHPTVNRHTLYVSADYPGIAMKKVEEAFGGNTVCMFIQGGAGNVNPMFQTDDNGTLNGKPEGYIPTTDFTMIEKMGALLANEVIAKAKELRPVAEEKAGIKAVSDSLLFTGRFDKEVKYNVHITTLLVNDKIAIAAFPGEPFVAHQLYWKQNAEAAFPVFFGYTFSSGGKSPGYVCDVRSAAYGGYGADASPRIIEVGAGETIMTRHLINLYRLKGIMKDEPQTIEVVKARLAK